MHEDFSSFLKIRKSAPVQFYFSRLALHDFSKFIVTVPAGYFSLRNTVNLGVET